MNNFSKIGLTTTAIVSMVMLSACQSSAVKPDAQAQRGHHFGHWSKLSPEQQAQRRADFQQIQHACASKNVGDATQVSFKDKTITGTCEIGFRPNRPAPQANATPNTQITTTTASDATANDVTQPPMHKIHKPMWQRDFKVFQHICDGRPVGQQLKVTFKDRTVFGTCEVQFRPDHKHRDHVKPTAPTVEVVTPSTAS